MDRRLKRVFVIVLDSMGMGSDGRCRTLRR